MKPTNQPTEAQVTSRARVWWKVIKQGNALFFKGTSHLRTRVDEHPVLAAYVAARYELSGSEIVWEYSPRVVKQLEELGVK